MKNKYSLLCFFLLGIIVTSQAQGHKTENIFLITLDGMRWQEVFAGIDPLLLNDTMVLADPSKLNNRFWAKDIEVRREKLMPFLWNIVEKKGQIYGNRAYGNLVDNANKLWFSYPGYNEVLSGFADDERIASNDKINNPNVTFLEYLNQRDEYKGKVRAFGSWDVFPYIINAERSGIAVNAGFATATNPSETEKLIARLQSEIRGPWGEVRLDPFTHHFALETIKDEKPSIVYIAYGETDDWAHGGNYEQYILAARQTDQYIQELWEYIQSDAKYADKTTMIITTDHGRGIDASSWTGHGARIPEAGQIWMAVIGPDTQAQGEMKKKGQWQSAMLARTVFTLLGLEYPDERAAPEIKEMIK